MKPSMLTGSTEGVLSRIEMKNIVAGSEFCGNIYCNIGGEQSWQGSGCGGDVMDQALNNCELLAFVGSTTCNGCAQFPAVQ
ncbi:MAG: hypothetical protein EA390_00310 [Balneolaceae bacterium]|nr:MAG: hypothetical protein EA390_00310 [Balneolaceae bacterium]